MTEAKTRTTAEQLDETEHRLRQKADKFLQLAEEIAERRSIGPGTDRRILFIEDDPLLARSYTRALEKTLQDVRCTNITNGIIALDEVVRAADQIDLIVLDLHLPALDGFVLLDKIPRGIPVIILSGRVQEIDLERVALERHADAYFTKPVDLDVLTEEVQRLFARRRLRFKQGN